MTCRLGWRTIQGSRSGTRAEYRFAPGAAHRQDGQVLIGLPRRRTRGTTSAVAALTAEQVLGDALGIHAGEQLLVHGADGVTSGMMVALAVLRSAEVIATAGPASRPRVSALGARHVIDYHDQDWPE